MEPETSIVERKGDVVNNIVENGGNNVNTEDASKEEQKKPQGNILVLATFILEFIIVALVIVLEYLLR